MRRFRRLLLPAILLLSLPACASDAWVELGGQRYSVEIADDDAERARGLMFRDRLEDGHGMLFIHDAEAPQAYWMKNTRIPLDILYFDDGRVLVSQQRNVPPCTLGNGCPPYPSDAPARYVLELNAGEAARLLLQDGATITFGPGIAAARCTGNLARPTRTAQACGMHQGTMFPDWNTLAGRDDETLPLFGTALLIARDEYPDLDPAQYDARAQAHADELRPLVENIELVPLKMQAINRHLFEELGYSGNHDEYYDPRNSYLNEVFERRLGNPISLALVQMEVTRRLGLPIEGVSFPGHFLVRMTVGDGVLVMDPFNRGRPLDEDELRERARSHLGGEMPDDEALFRILHPASHRAMLTRMLRNLHGVYTERGDWERAVRSADRILKISPDNPEALRDRGLGYFKLGHRHGARADLGRYLQLHPQAADAASLHERVVELSSGVARPH